MYNETEYHGWNQYITGIKRDSGRDKTGCFGVVNLRAPHPSGLMQGPRHWASLMTTVQLRFDFLKESRRHASSSGRVLVPYTLARTYITFFDLDMGQQNKTLEAIQVGCSQGSHSARGTLHWSSALFSP